MLRLAKALLADRRVRFILVGGMATAIDVGLYLALIWPWLAVEPHLAAVLSYAIAFAFSFTVQRSVTFRAGSTGRGDTLRQFFRFLAVQLVGLGMSLGFVQLAELAAVHPGWAVVPKVLLVPPITYILARSWAFRPERRAIP